MQNTSIQGHSKLNQSQQQTSDSGFYFNNLQDINSEDLFYQNIQGSYTRNKYFYQESTLNLKYLPKKNNENIDLISDIDIPEDSSPNKSQLSAHIKDIKPIFFQSFSPIKDEQVSSFQALNEIQTHSLSPDILRQLSPSPTPKDQKISYSSRNIIYTKPYNSVSPKQWKSTRYIDNNQSTIFKPSYREEKYTESKLKNEQQQEPETIFNKIIMVGKNNIRKVFLQKNSFEYMILSDFRFNKVIHTYGIQFYIIIFFKAKLIKFGQRMKEYSQSYKFRQFLKKKKLYSILADKSHYIFAEEPFKICNRVINVINPHSYFCITWNILKFLIFLFELFYIPFENTFLHLKSPQKTISYNIYLFSLFLFTLSDILLTFNIGIYLDGFIITNRKKIAKQYLKHTFSLDLIGTISILISLSFQNQKFLFIFMIQILQIQQLFNYINNEFQIQQRFNSLYQLYILLSTVLYVGHLGACLFYSVSCIQITNGEHNTWIQVYGFTNLLYYEAYIESLYFSFITMVTVGYGDISPQNRLEKTVTIFIALISCGLFAFAVSSIGQIITQAYTISTEISMKKYKALKYMNKRNINNMSKMKVIKALEYMHQQEEKGNREGLQIINSISQSIQEEIFTDYFTNVLSQSRLFKQCKFSEIFKQKMALKLKELTTSPDQFIFQQGQQSDKLYFLMEGSLEVFFHSKIPKETQTKTIHILKSKQQTELGTQYLFNQDVHKYSVKSQSVCRIVYLSFKDFYETLDIFQQDKEKFQMIKERFILDHTSTSEQCLICFSYTHQSQNCSLTHLIPNRQITITKSHNQEEQPRQRYFRRYQSKNNSTHSILNRDQVNYILRNVRYQLIKEQTEHFEMQDFLDQSDKDFYYIMPKLVFSEDKFIIQPHQQQQNHINC